MSILIKGMEMPEGCDECALRSLGFGKMFCPITGEDVSNQDYAKNRHEKCPLVEIPTPHGRLIDADELLRQPMNTANYPKNYVHVAPTIIEAEVSKG